MSDRYLIKLDISKIKELEPFYFHGKKADYLDVTLWINDKPDNYGNIVSINHYNKETKEKTYIGNGKSAESISRTENKQTGNIQEQEEEDVPF
jgi:hypothetical protein